MRHHSKESGKVAIYVDAIGDYDSMWGRCELLYHKDNTRTMQ